jgi:hypothetical protein
VTVLGWVAIAGAAPVTRGAGADEWSIGAATSWRTTPLRAQWAEPVRRPHGERHVPDASWRSEPAIHLVGSRGIFVADLAIGNELGWNVWSRGYEEYSGWRGSVRVGVTALSTRAPRDAIDPINVSVGVGGMTWLACCSASGAYSGVSPRYDPPASATVWAANRLWLWEPLGLDLRYEVPLAPGQWFSTVEAAVVFARRR